MLTCCLPSYCGGCCHRFKKIAGTQISEKRVDVHVLLAMMCWLPTQENVIRLPCYLLRANNKKCIFCGLLMRSCSCSDWEHIGRNKTRKEWITKMALILGFLKGQKRPLGMQQSTVNSFMQGRCCHYWSSTQALVWCMITKKRTFSIFAMMKMTFYLCPTMSFFTGSYDQNTFRGAPWQVQSQGANTDKCTGNQLQLANVANQGNACEKWKHTGVDMKNKLAKDGKRLTSYVGKNAEPSCSTWHQAAPMYLPSTSYTGESIKKWSCRRWISRRSIVDNCSCHDWTTAVAIPGQLRLPSVENCGCHPWTTAVAIHGQLQLPCMIKCDCNV